ncbi:hypothetical protein LSCM1_03508 [Leishmania martiniquensis]|uniref:Uncharacterized protein n=1 Tax=Leishmania martiniquensis TaxID=1580590 RepID=A0A836H0N0_9TRYP|nr:hypothetical protein LSCM1_03508 [Leishmania martiniquensis]
MAASAFCPAVHLHSFKLLACGDDAANAAPSSAPLTAPLSFSLTFQFCRCDEAGGAPTTNDLGVAVDFVADVASKNATVALLPLTPLGGPRTEADSIRSNGAFAVMANPSDSSGSSSDGAASAPVDDDVGAAPGTMYRLTVHLNDLRALGEVELKHLLQVSMMRVRLVHLGASDGVTDSDASSSRTQEGSLAEWNVVWQVRRSPQGAKELIRTVLDPLA